MWAQLDHPLLKASILISVCQRNTHDPLPSTVRNNDGGGNDWRTHFQIFSLLFPEYPPAQAVSHFRSSPSNYTQVVTEICICERSKTDDFTVTYLKAQSSIRLSKNADASASCARVVRQMKAAICYGLRSQPSRASLAPSPTFLASLLKKLVKIEAMSFVRCDHRT